MKFKYLPEIDPIQKDILLTLMRAETLKFSNIKPKELESDQFNYHLQYLVKKGIILNEKGKYGLTRNGVKLVEQFDVKGTVYDQFKYAVMLYVKNKDLYLMHKWTRFPFFGEVMCAAGKIRKGELINDAAKRKLLEETGLVGNFEFLGSIRKIKYYSDGTLFTDEIFNVCYCDKIKGELIKINDFGENFWCTYKEAKRHIKQALHSCKEDLEILNRIEKKDLSLFHYQAKMTVKE